MAYLYELEGIYAQLQAMELDDETFNDTLESIDFKENFAQSCEWFIKMQRNEAMMLTNQQKVDTGLFKLSLRKTESVTVFDLSKLSDEFLKEKVEPNKTEIKKAIKSGQVVSGAELTEGRSVIVK